jgi:hypothetical protein
MNRSAQRDKKEISALTKTYDLIAWMVPTLEKFPKSQRFLLGDRIQSALLDILEFLIRAAYTRNKENALREANFKLETVRYLTRLCKDLKYLSIRRYEFASRSIDDIGAEIGGWLKYTRSVADRRIKGPVIQETR